MGSSYRLATAVLICLATLAAQEHGKDSTPLKRLPKQLPEIVLSDAKLRIPVRDFGLGDGGVTRKQGLLQFHPTDGCVTPGGVHVACRAVGVKLTFPSGREVLLAPDGGLHLRSGEVAGPFPSGLEIMLGDGTRVSITLAQSRRVRVRDVWVSDSAHSLHPWRLGKAAAKTSKSKSWSGLRLACCGEGDDIYRPLAIGPLLVLDRILVRRDRRDKTPSERLVLLSDSIRQSLLRMPRQHRETDAPVRRAVAAIVAVAEHSDLIFPRGAALRRAQHDKLRWMLGRGFELQLDLDSASQPYLQLFAGSSPLPMVEWTLGRGAVAYLTNPREGQLGKRWHGNGTRLVNSLPELQARDHLHERQYALAVMQRFKH